jgi:hypothetical protein
MVYLSVSGRGAHNTRIQRQGMRDGYKKLTIRGTNAYRRRREKGGKETVVLVTNTKERVWVDASGMRDRLSGG